MLTTISIISQLIFQDEFQKHFNLKKRSLTYLKMQSIKKEVVVK